MIHINLAAFRALGLAKRRADIERRRAQVAILRLVRPAMSAEDVARELKCSPSTVRGDWRALRSEIKEKE